MAGKTPGELDMHLRMHHIGRGRALRPLRDCAPDRSGRARRIALVACCLPVSDGSKSRSTHV